MKQPPRRRPQKSKTTPVPPPKVKLNLVGIGRTNEGLGM